VVVAPVVTVNEAVVGDAAVCGNVTELVNVAVEPVGAPLEANDTVPGNPVVVDPVSKLTVTLYVPVHPRTTARSGDATATE
jgi:hypothetical protein